MSAKAFDLVLVSSLLAVYAVAVAFSGRAVFRRIRARNFAGAILPSLGLLFSLWVGLWVGFTPGSAAYHEYSFTKSLFGRGFLLSAPIHKFGSARHFNGDGYSIFVYRISQKRAAQLQQELPALSWKYPLKPTYREGWSQLPWRQTPVAENEMKFLEFASSEEGEVEELQNAISLLKRYAAERGNYFACAYMMFDDRVANIDFILVSPTNRVLIFVNHNT